jgi:hypothetical protein
MGPARGRGTPEERAAEALARAVGVRPPAMSCNGCKAALPAAQRIDTRALPGIELAFKAHCAACDQDTWAVRGTAPAVRAFYAALEKSVGHAAQMGSVKPATDD